MKRLMIILLAMILSINVFANSLTLSAAFMTPVVEISYEQFYGYHFSTFAQIVNTIVATSDSNLVKEITDAFIKYYQIKNEDDLIYTNANFYHNYDTLVANHGIVVPSGDVVLQLNEVVQNWMDFSSGKKFYVENEYYLFLKTFAEDYITNNLEDHPDADGNTEHIGLDLGYVVYKSIPMKSLNAYNFGDSERYEKFTNYLKENEFPNGTLFINLTNFSGTYQSQYWGNTVYKYYKEKNDLESRVFLNINGSEYFMEPYYYKDGNNGIIRKYNYSSVAITTITPDMFLFNEKQDPTYIDTNNTNNVLYGYGKTGQYTGALTYLHDAVSNQITDPWINLISFLPECVYDENKNYYVSDYNNEWDYQNLYALRSPNNVAYTGFNIHDYQYYEDNANGEAFRWTSNAAGYVASGNYLEGIKLYNFAVSLGDKSQYFYIFYDSNAMYKYCTGTGYLYLLNKGQTVETDVQIDMDIDYDAIRKSTYDAFIKVVKETGLNGALDNLNDQLDNVNENLEQSNEWLEKIYNLLLEWKNEYEKPSGDSGNGSGNTIDYTEQLKDITETLKHIEKILTDIESKDWGSPDDESSFLGKLGNLLGRLGADVVKFVKRLVEYFFNAFNYLSSKFIQFFNGCVEAAVESIELLTGYNIFNAPMFVGFMEIVPDELKALITLAIFSGILALLFRLWRGGSD